MKLSIISINYNNKIGLEKTIQSVVNQAYKIFEYIIIDGNSTDGSQEVIERYKEKITFSISEPDSGIYNAMNKGIKVANGEFILFINSGDSFFDNNVLKNVVPKLNAENSIYYGNLNFSIDSQAIRTWNPPSQLSFSYLNEFSLPHPSTFLKRELFEKHFYYNEDLKIVSDWEFFMYCICKKDEKYQYIDLLISDFDNTGISSNIENSIKIAEEKERVLKTHFPLFQEDSKLLKEIKSKRFQQIIKLKNSKLKWKLMKSIINLMQIFESKQ